MANVSCTSTLDKNAECTWCTNRKKERGDLLFWEIKSDHPQRNMVVTVCDECMDQIIDCEGCI